MWEFDSRSLNQINCVAHRFVKPGVVRYTLMRGGQTRMSVGSPASAGWPYQIIVGPATPGGPTHHQISVSWNGSALQVDPVSLEIGSHDIVVWNSQSAAAPVYAIQADGPDGRFDSRALRDESFYTHVFGLAGKYEWHDALGGHASGTITVAPVDFSAKDAHEKWLATLANGVGVTVTDKDVSPRNVNIVFGQTVAFHIRTSHGIAIVDNSVASWNTRADG
jgi:hypothetical protein